MKLMKNNLAVTVCLKNNLTHEIALQRVTGADLLLNFTMYNHNLSTFKNSTEKSGSRKVSLELLVVCEHPGGGVRGIAPFGHPVVWNEALAAREELLKHLPVVVGLFRFGDIALESL